MASESLNESIYGIPLGDSDIAPWPNHPAKVIFLDFVLNSRGILDYGDERIFDLDSVEALNNLLEQSNGLIVISSDWRIKRSLKEFAKILSADGVNERKVIGKTPHIEDAERGFEINAWLKEVPFQVESFVIIDDDKTIKMRKDQLVLTQEKIGFCNDLIVDCLDKLSRLVSYEWYPKTERG